MVSLSASFHIDRFGCYPSLEIKMQKVKN